MKSKFSCLQKFRTSSASIAWLVWMYSSLVPKLSSLSFSSSSKSACCGVYKVLLVSPYLATSMSLSLRCSNPSSLSSFCNQSTILYLSTLTKSRIYLVSARKHLCLHFLGHYSIDQKFILSLFPKHYGL